MADQEKDQSLSKPHFDAAPEAASPNTQESAHLEQDTCPQTSTPRTLEVLVVSQTDTSVTKEVSEQEKMDEEALILPGQLDREEELLGSPSTPESTGTLDDATEQLSKLKMKRPNLTTAQRREALKAKLLARGEEFDPSKWRRGKKKKLKKPEVGGTPGPNAGPDAGSKAAKRPRGAMATPPSVEGPAKKARSSLQNSEDNEVPGTSGKDVSYRDIAATKVAIVPENYPEAKLTEEQGEKIEDAILEQLQPLEDGSSPSFSGIYLEKGALIASCLSDATKRWLEGLFPALKPIGEQITLKAGPRKDILRSTRVFFRAHPKLLRKTPEKVIEMLHMQNPALNVKEWRILPAKPDPKGYGFVCFLDEVCFQAVKRYNHRANLGFWQVSLVSTSARDNAQGPPDQPTTQ